MSIEYNQVLLKQVMLNTGLSKKICIKYLEKNNYNIEKTFQEIDKNIKSGKIETPLVVYGNISNASTNYGMDKFNTPRGHGFAAERANHIYDKLHMKNAEIIGDNNAKNGADRIVNGVNIQTKYCANGSKCISECFENGKLKYLNPDGTPMKIEVPSDKYDSAIQSMKDRIEKGQVPGVTDPNEAKNIVKKGHFTYEQAKNIAKSGTVESIAFDAVNGAIIASTSMGISTVITFAVSIWNGDDFDMAIKKATHSGLKIGGTTFVTAVLSSQLTRAGLNSALVGSSEAVVSLMGPKASAVLVNSFRSGSNIYGAAAMKSAAKMLRGNAITGAVSVVVLSSFDIANIFRGRISGAQLFKNITNTASTVAGGTAGWVGGATLGASIGSVIPGVGTAIGSVVGGVIGSFAGGTVAGKASGTILDEFIEDDANKMIKIIEDVFTQLSTDYLLSKKEAENIVDNLKNILDGSKLKEMFATSDKHTFAKNMLLPLISKEVYARRKIIMPSDKQFAKGLSQVLEDISDEMCLI